MGKVIITDDTCKNPITMIGRLVGLCYGSDTSNDEKNYKRGYNCITSGHVRTIEFPDVYMHIEGYSARVIRELYTHIGGSPTRVQESTRYIDYSNFEYVIPPEIKENPQTKADYEWVMKLISVVIENLMLQGIPKEDAAMLLPLGMTTGVSCKYNARTLASMAEQRLCTRAYWEYRQLMRDMLKELSNYSEEWKTLVELTMKCKCDWVGYCLEEKSCGKCPKK